MANLVNDTLSAWLLVESLQPGEVKYDKGSTLPKSNFQNNEQQKQLQSFDDYYDIWNDERYTIAEQSQNTVKEYFVYIEIAFTIKKLIKKFKIFLTITQKFSTQMKSVVMAIHSKLMKMEK